MAMAHNIAVLGASLGGLIAAAELRSHGCKVTIIEKGHSVGGLYSEASTPFGSQEIGMHVIYANNSHYKHLSDIFGAASFHTMTGSCVDKGASANFGEIYFGSHYPCLLEHPLRNKILEEILAITEEVKDYNPSNAEEESTRRFGVTAGRSVVGPILEKLWNTEPKHLTKDALHCFFDLRRLVIAHKNEADILKECPRLDNIIANPEQDFPKGQVYGGRMGLLFRKECKGLSDSVNEWARRSEINISYDSDVKVLGGNIIVNNELLRDQFDACIVAVPIHLLADAFTADPHKADKSELSIYYYQLEQPLGKSFSTYYILAHDPHFSSSRVVNYDSYRPSDERTHRNVICVEAIHKPRAAPSINKIHKEISQLLPSSKIIDSYQFPKPLSIYTPTIDNRDFLNGLESSIRTSFAKPIFFTGMRTDTGIFFSHHTIGLAYDSALECIEQLS